MIAVLPFAQGDLCHIEPQSGQRVELLTLAHARTLEQWWSFTVVDERMRILMCAGALPDQEGVWWGWALLSVHARRRMLALSRAVLGILPRTPADKIRTAVRWGFREGHEWALMLGFTPMRELYRLDGIWCAIYERDVRCGS